MNTLMKLLDLLGLQTLVTNIKNAVQGGTWLNVKNGSGTGSVVEGNLSGNTSSAQYSHAEGGSTTAKENYAHAEGYNSTAGATAAHAEGYGTNASGVYSHTEGLQTSATQSCGHAEGAQTSATGAYSHAEGKNVMATGDYCHAQGTFNYPSTTFIDTVGVGTSTTDKKNAEVTIKSTSTNNGYKYLLGVGGYTGQAIGTARSVQQVISAIQSDISSVTSSASSTSLNVVSLKTDVANLWTSVNNKADKSHTHTVEDIGWTVRLKNSSSAILSDIGSTSSNGYWLKVIRSQDYAPDWYAGAYSGGIAFGGEDTKSVVSLAYSTPKVMFAAGTHSSGILWRMCLLGTANKDYNLDLLPTKKMASISAILTSSASSTIAQRVNAIISALKSSGLMES